MNHKRTSAVDNSSSKKKINHKSQSLDGPESPTSLMQTSSLNVQNISTGGSVYNDGLVSRLSPFRMFAEYVGSKAAFTAASDAEFRSWLFDRDMCTERAPAGAASDTIIMNDAVYSSVEVQVDLQPVNAAGSNTKKNKLVIDVDDIKPKQVKPPQVLDTNDGLDIDDDNYDDDDYDKISMS